MGAAMGGGGGGGGSAFDEYGGIDPSMDPELAMAIRASTEEARAQEEARVGGMSVLTSVLWASQHSAVLLSPGLFGHQSSAF